MKTFRIENNVRDNIKVWGAKILGLDTKYGFKRHFCSYKYLNDCSSKHAYYDYYIDAENGDFIEVGIRSAYKNKKYYYKVENNELVSINTRDIIKYFQENVGLITLKYNDRNNIVIEQIKEIKSE